VRHSEIGWTARALRSTRAILWASTYGWQRHRFEATRISRLRPGCSTPVRPVSGAARMRWRRHRVPERPVATAIRCARSPAQLRSSGRVRTAP
jgi:hypothetical protein